MQGQIFATEGLCCGYGQAEVLHEVDVSLDHGQVVSLVGANGAGKTTFADCCIGYLRARRGRILIEGKDIARASSSQRVRMGLSYVPAGGRVFANLSVLDNIRVAGLDLRALEHAHGDHGILTRFPWLERLLGREAGSLSGGERQLVAIARALVQNPKLLILDEPSLGLSPLALADVYNSIEVEARRGGIGVIIIEQNVRAAFAVSTRAYVLNGGRIVHLIEDPDPASAEEVVGKLIFGEV